MKYYKNTSDLLHRIEAYAIYNDGMPEDVPGVFKKSKLVCFDDVSIENSQFSGPSTVSVHHKSFTDAENISKKIFFCEEITQEEYERIENAALDIIQKFKDTLSGLL